MKQRIGVFICACGTNIAEVVNTEKLAEFSRSLEGVAAVQIHRLWCSEEGKAEIRRAVKEQELTRVVIAACSPKQYEAMFQKLIASEGLNPYFLQIVNIREQVAWVTKDPAAATEKALALLHAAILRVQLHEPLAKTEIECNNDYLVIGAGAAGISAALALAQKNRKVHVVERDPWIGGRTISYEEVFPSLECATCMMDPKMDELLHHERIEVHTNSEVENVRGFFGNFEVQLRQKARFVDAAACIGCGACLDVCPVSVKNKFNRGLSERHAIYYAFAGVMPNVPVIDTEQCLRFKGEACTKCQEACGFGAINYDQKDSVVNATVGAIVVATGFDLFDGENLKHLGYGLPSVFESLQFERLLSSTGPTGGEILSASGAAPRSIAFIHCAGSRDKKYKEYCSGLCCSSTLKQAHVARKKLKDAALYEFFSDWCLPGKGCQEFQHSVSGDGTAYIRVADPSALRVENSGDQLVVKSAEKSVTVDMVVLAPALVPARGTEQLAALLGLERDKDGFFSAEHEKLSPSSTTTRGIYIAGCAAGPKDIAHSALQGQAAAGLALSALVPGEKIELEVAVSAVDEALCGGCRVCEPLCPFQAIGFDREKNTAAVNEMLCRGCGVCVAGCPAGAITNRHFTNKQISAEIKGVLR